MENMLERLAKLHICNKKIAVMMRHGEREIIPSGQFGSDLMLTKRGIRTVIDFGEKYRNTILQKFLLVPFLVVCKQRYCFNKASANRLK